MHFNSLRILLFGSLVCIAQWAAGQSPTFSKIWDRRYGGTNDENIINFEKTPDGGFILGGTSYSSISADKTEANWDTTGNTPDYWLVRTDSLSNKLWDKRFGGTDSEVLFEVIVTADGGFLCGGESYSNVSGDKTQPNWDFNQQSNDYWIVKTDSNGVKLWDRTYGGTTFDLFGSLKETSFGGYYLCGSSVSGIDGNKSDPNVGGWDMWIVRIDAAGNKIWDRTFGGLTNDYATASMATPDGGIVVGGYSNSDVGGDKSQPSQGTWDYWVIKIDSSGNKVWDRTLGGSYLDYMFSICATGDGGIIAAGQSFSDASGDKTEPNHDISSSGSDHWIIKLDAAGNKIWDRTYGASQVEQLNRIVRTYDNGFMLSGESYSPLDGDKTEANLGVEQTWVLKIDSIGDIEWDKTIFTTGHDELGTAVEIDSLCFVVVNYTAADTGGYKTQLSWGMGDYWMVKVCKDVETGLFEPSSTADHELKAYPVPAGDFLEVDIPQGITGTVSTALYSAHGALVLNVQTEIADPEGAKIRLDIQHLGKGIYFLKLSTREGASYYKKVIRN
jgi:hypothetical protein